MNATNRIPFSHYDEILTTICDYIADPLSSPAQHTSLHACELPPCSDGISTRIWNYFIGSTLPLDDAGYFPLQMILEI